MKEKYRTNFAALLMAVILLALWYYCRADVRTCIEATSQRDNFAYEVANSIKSGKAIEHEEIDRENARINAEIQALAMNTDMGKLLAKNDLSEEGRGYNDMIFFTFYVFVVFLSCVILLNSFRLLIDIFWVLPRRIRYNIRKSKKSKAKSQKKVRDDVEANHDEFEEDQDVE